jgi:hypothetical protein
MARKRLGEILVQAGVLDEARLRAGLSEQRRWGGPLGRLLVDMKLITEEAMVQALSHQLNFPAVSLENRQISAEVLDLVPGELAEQHSVIPFNVQGKFLDVAMSDPTNLGIIDELRIRTRLNVRPYLAGPKMIERAIGRFYGRGMAAVDVSFGGGGRDASASMPAGTRTFEMPARDVRTPDQDTPQTYGAASPSPAAARRAQQFDFAESGSRDSERAEEISALQARVQHLEALVSRDEDVLRKLLGLLIEKGLATREEILERIK